mgnify:CR=1 FL=1
MVPLLRAYPVYGKTGTSDWADLGVAYGIPVLAMKDEWMINYTSEYTIATWSGFDAAKEGAYFTMDMINANIPAGSTNPCWIPSAPTLFVFNSRMASAPMAAV